ncbi:MAG TPA: AsmA-like C-terminal region-containing protein [Bacteroidales bacterium]|nr:AsmA-like C-terminal region-containing protein [Bacteroidales bacterium]
MNSWIPARFSVKYVAALALLIAAVAFTGSALISMSYEKTIVRYLKGYLEEHLTTRLSMDENIRFRFLRGFPNTTVEIKNVLLLSGADFARKDFKASYSDTLLFAPSAYLRFNPFKMLRKEYELKKIEISHGTINILFDNKNNNNLKIWKSENKGSAGYSINLKNIIISDSRVRVYSLKNRINFEGQSVRTIFRGSLSSGVLSGETKSHFRIKRFTHKEKNLALNSNLQLAIDMIYGGSRFRVTKGTLQLNKASAIISGEYIAGKNSEVDLKLIMTQFGLNELMSVLPIKVKSDKYEFDGTGNLQLMIKGPLANTDRLVITSSFVLRDCHARNKSNRATLSDLTIRGIISGTNAKNFHLNVDTFHARLGKGNFDGRISINNLNSLLFKADIKAYTDLRELSNFTGLDSIELAGNVNCNFYASGSLKGISDNSLKDLLQTLKNGRFDFNNVTFKSANLPFAAEKITGRATWNEFITIDSISLKLNETELLVNGEVKNLQSYLTGNGLLKPDLFITSDKWDITKYLNNRQNNSGNTTGQAITGFPEDIYLKARLHIKRFTAGKFEATDVSANLSAIEDSVFLDQLKLGFPDGSITGIALLKMEPGREYSVTCRAEPDRINIRQLFYVFNNFTQSFIQDKNLKGELGGVINFYARWDSSFKIIPATVKAKGDIQITNGELVQFEPMLKLSKYIDVDELKHIRFKTLKNSIFISDRLVSIPEMNINSSAFNISVSGQHSFDNIFDYRMRVLLSEVLFNKARKKKQELNEFYVAETSADQTTIPLIIAGTPQDFDVKFDRKKAFSLSRHRNNINQPKPNGANFKVEWEEPKDVPVERPDRTDDPSGVVIEWEE